MNKKGKWFLLLLLLFGGVLSVFQIYNQVTKVNVTGCQYYSEEEIKENLLTGIESKNSLLFYWKARYIGLKELPYVEKVAVKRVSNHEITIRIYEKNLVACVKYMSQYLYFDKDGIVLGTSGEAIEGVPRISGLTFSGFQIYQPLEVEETEIFNRILDISQIIRRYELSVDKIHFSDKNEVSLTAGGIKIYLGKREFYDEPIAALAEILPEAGKENLKGSINMENYQNGDDVIFRKQTKG